ncbi:uncharacterized protein LOC141586560 [Silene latifolia]|uniref:uncharacterized protein LOC141586560 n=1 Tax=Silene latifolia TaxID=37657 RepID=UPI003D76FE98
MMLYANLPKRFWGECLLAATYIINRLPTAILGWRTPYELLLGSVPSYYDHLKVIGCQCFALIPSKQRDKFQSKGRRCVFIGYPHGQKAYKLFDLDTQKILISRDVEFQEHVFPYKSNKTKTTMPFIENTSLSTSNPNFLDQLLDEEITITNQPNTNNFLSITNTQNTSSETADHVIPASIDQISASSPPVVELVVPSIPRNTSRVRSVPSWLKDYDYPTLSKSTGATAVSSGAAFSILDQASYPAHLLKSLNNVMSVVEPTTYKQAKQNPLWVAAMSKELAALESSNPKSIFFQSA